MSYKLDQPPLPGVEPGKLGPRKRRGVRLSGARERKLRVLRGLPRYTPGELQGRRLLAKAQWLQRRSMIDQIKLELGCADCGYDTHPAALEFDHLPGTTKGGDISQLLRAGAAMRTIFCEIEKCEIVCANCHRVRTADRQADAGEPER